MKKMMFGLLIATVIGLSGCGDGGGGNSAQPVDTVSGIVSVDGNLLSGTVYLTDSASPPKNLFTAIAADGFYSINVTGMTKPYQLKAYGNTNGQYYTLHALAADKGTTNINPSTNGDPIIPESSGLVQGIVTDPQTGAALVGATVNAYVQVDGSPKTLYARAIAATAITGAHGEYSIRGLTIGTTYFFEFVRSGYVVLTYYNIVPAVSILVLQNVMPIPEAWQSMTATVSGKVKNASTNSGLPDMTVKIRPGIANRTGSTITATTTTDAAGAYSFANLPTGAYTAEVTGKIGSTPIITSYFTMISFYNNPTANSNQDFPVTTPLSSDGTGQYRIVLNWGNNPRDLDSHLTGPTESVGSRFHTAYYDEDYPRGTTTFDFYGNRIAGAGTQVFLDIDNTEHGYDNGPETTTIVATRSGIYRYYVHHFAGSSTISNSGAQVKVYKGSALLATFNPPYSLIGDDAVWSVFTMDVGTSGETITPVNTISSINSESLPKMPATAFDEYYLFRNMPRNK